MGNRTVRFLVLAASVLGLWAVASPAGATSQRPASAMSSLEQGVLANINGFRHDHGLAPLRFSSKLAAAARSHSGEMARRGYFSHDSANGASFDRRISRYYSVAGKQYWSVGENLLWSSPDVDATGALNMWLNSPEHRTILLTARWREIGLSAVHVASASGTYGGREVTIVTADFGVRR
ncbi:MAG: CAP domain-containing protein [Actinobacteria bacterium]|nr:CAP domain-containing protein [Actinomycetota bacterium]